METVVEETSYLADHACLRCGKEAAVLQPLDEFSGSGG